MVRQCLQTGLGVVLNHKYTFALNIALQVPSYIYANSFPMHVLNFVLHGILSIYSFI